MDPDARGAVPAFWQWEIALGSLKVMADATDAPAPGFGLVIRGGFVLGRDGSGTARSLPARAACPSPGRD